jgi:hypothetical protein
MVRKSLGAPPAAHGTLPAEPSTAADTFQRPLRSRFRARLTRSVRPCGQKANPQDREASQPHPLACHTPHILMRHVDQRYIFR